MYIYGHFVEQVTWLCTIMLCWPEFNKHLLSDLVFLIGLWIIFICYLPIRSDSILIVTVRQSDLVELLKKQEVLWCEVLLWHAIQYTIPTYNSAGSSQLLRSIQAKKSQHKSNNQYFCNWSNLFLVNFRIRFAEKTETLNKCNPVTLLS